GEVLACAPGFFTDYSLDTTLTDFGRRLVAATRRVAPRAFTLRLASLGSPCTEDVGLGFAPQVAPGLHAGLIGQITSAFEAAAAEAGCWLMAIKDAPEPQREAWAQVARAAGYAPQPG